MIYQMRTTSDRQTLWGSSNKGISNNVYIQKHPANRATLGAFRNFKILKLKEIHILLQSLWIHIYNADL